MQYKITLGLLFLLFSCNTNIDFIEYNSVDGIWHKDSIQYFNFELDSAENLSYKSFVNLRIDEKYQFENWPISYEECYKYEKECNKILGLKAYHTDFYYKKFNKDFNQFHRRFASNLRFKDVYYDLY